MRIPELEFPEKSAGCPAILDGSIEGLSIGMELKLESAFSMACSKTCTAAIVLQDVVSWPLK